MIEGLSLDSVISSSDVVITYTPPTDVVSYTYTVITNGIYGDYITINNNEAININLNNTGSYIIEIKTLDYLGNSDTIVSGEYKIDKDAPIINVENKTYKIKQNQEFDFMSGITASDMVDGDLTGSIKTNINEIDFSKEGIKTIEYSVSDLAGNTTTQKVFVTVMHDNTNLIRLGQLGIIIVFLAIILFLYKYIRSIKLEKRFSKYTINSSKNNSISLLDVLYNQYIDFINRISKFLSKSKFISDRSNKYNKYISAFGFENNNINFMARKVILGFVYIVIAIIVKLIQSTLLQPIEMIIPFILGFYTLDIIYIYKYAMYRKKIESDMSEAITVMNNAFKSGRSIIQAIDLVSEELNGPIANEFKKISMELSFGLDIEIAFRRFAERIKVDDALYLTSSLSVLNKTGGNIIKVFDSIEKNMFNRKKLQEELKSLTSSSKLIMYVLMLVPIIFVIFINIINKGYFKPLFTSPIGLILIFAMLIIYVTYIILVRKVMKVRM